MKKLSVVNEVVHIHGREISYYDVSTCVENPVGAYVVIHGALGNSETTVDFATSLATKVQDHAVVLVDLPGHGNSPGEALTTIKEIAGVVTNFVQTLQESNNYGDTVYLVGHSMGGSVVLQMLVDGFNASKAAILMSSPEWSSMASMNGIPEDQIQDVFEQMMTFEFEHLSDRDQYISRIPYMSAGPKAAIADLKALSTFNILPEAAKIKAPLLIVASEYDDTASLESVEALASKLTNYGSHIVMGGTHTAVIGHAEEVADVVARF
ncbi:alpha/beta hydrolase [Paenibacillus amylolyticus]|uniref:Alpha/beta hydrolase n=1 Tax=Paenibacillus amylolyticus TaxID=1451 RepID=A0ABD8B2R0_PAEAM